MLPESRMNLGCGLMSKSNRNRQVSTQPFTANLPVFLVFGFFQTPNSTVKRARNGTAIVS